MKIERSYRERLKGEGMDKIERQQQRDQTAQRYEHRNWQEFIHCPVCQANGSVQRVILKLKDVKQRSGAER